MFNTRRPHAVIWLTLGTVLLLGCTTPKPVMVVAPPAQPAIAPKPALSVNTPVEVIVADPRGKAILNGDVPGLLSNPKYQLFSDMSLVQLSTLSCGRLTKAKLAQVQADLAQLSAEEAAGQ